MSSAPIPRKIYVHILSIYIYKERKGESETVRMKMTNDRYSVSRWGYLFVFGKWDFRKMFPLPDYFVCDSECEFFDLAQSLLEYQPHICICLEYRTL